jgi:hypothetical protein
MEHCREFAYILNTLLRRDDKEAAEHLAVVVRTINVLLVHQRGSRPRIMRSPQNNTVYRGGGLPDEHRSFYHVGKKYRVPGFLATSLDEDVARGFMRRGAAERNIPCVLWVIMVPPGCMQVHYVERTVDNIGEEQEYLFAPYSPFVVSQVSFRSLLNSLHTLCPSQEHGTMALAHGCDHGCGHGCDRDGLEQ